MKKVKAHFSCAACGYRSPKWLGRCPACNEWHSFAEEEDAGEPIPGAPPAWGGTEVASLALQPEKQEERQLVGLGEVDRVLGGGLVKGAAVLVGGEPGIGKSTLVLEIMKRLAQQGLKTLYVSGEESVDQIRIRAGRTGARSENILVFNEIDLEAILRQAEARKPDLLVIDSIQTVYSPTSTTQFGSVNQIRECAVKLIFFCKSQSIPLFIIGHVTKEGTIAGPKAMEHLVDTVLYFEGDAGHHYRIVRAVKNRFGPTNEIGVFEMSASGLLEVPNPSSFFLAQGEASPGSVVAATLEGSRPFLVEIQSLVIPNNFGMPRRTTNGADHNRLALLVAVMDKLCGCRLSGHDIFLNIVGGIKVAEPAVDLAMVASLFSSLKERSAVEKTVIFGEVGLTGEIRAVSQASLRVREAQRLGFCRCLLPASQKASLSVGKNMELIGLSNLRELGEYLF